MSLHQLRSSLGRAKTTVRSLWLSLALAALSLAVIPTAQAGEILYAGDYNGQKVVRFDGVTGVPIPVNPFIVGGGESVAGFGNHILNEESGHIQQYNLTTGAFEKSFVPTGSGLGLAVALDAQSVYVTQSGSIDQYSLASGNYGALLHHANTFNSWGVAINPVSGKVYVNNGWSNGATGIQVFNADLSGGTTLVGANDHGMTAGAGLVFSKDGSKFFAVNGGNHDPNNSFVNEYLADGTFVKTIQFGNIIPSNRPFTNAFGAAVNNAGNIFVSSQRDNAVLEINLSNNDAVSLFVTPSNGASQSIKTIFFSGQTVLPTPEPSTLFLAFVAAPIGLVAVYRRRKSAVC